MQNALNADETNAIHPIAREEGGKERYFYC